MTGVELLNRLQIAGKALPAILVTEVQQQPELHRYPWLQISATLLEPYAVADLLRTVKRVRRPAAGNGKLDLAGTVARA